MILLLCSFLPQWWVKRVIRLHSGEIDTLPGTGGELAVHLIKRFDLNGVRVEETKPFTDHYDPNDNCVRLGADNYHGKSVTAIAIAAHEVGHAMQFTRGETISKLRGKYIPVSIALGKLGAWLLLAFPLVSIITKSPSAMIVMLGLSVLLQLAGAAMYLIVLPEEWDASFNKALPILLEGEYLPEEHLDGARKVLRAAALTYFAGALASVANIGRWLLLLRR
ncbi:MAG: zinc metallopeptidase [Acidiferrobacterales bacterium]|nr:zinc metallopeptidase [Acidiferrobacterales bacterium]